MLNLVIIGAGGFGRELLPWIEECFDPADYRVRGFLDGNPQALADHDIDLPVLAAPDDYQPEPDDRLILALGNVPARARIAGQLEARGGRFASMIHPTAVIASTATLGIGAVIYPYAVISNQAVLEPHVHLSLYASVGHDAHVGRYSLLSPYATLNGAVKLGREVFLGTHAAVAPGVQVGDGVRISANSVAMRDVAPSMFVLGVPGKAVRLPSIG